MTSLLILIFLLHPKHKSSSVQCSFVSTSGGFFLDVVCENTIGVVDLWLRLLEREIPDICSASFLGEAAWLVNSGSEMSNVVLFLDKEAEELLLLIILLIDDAAISVALFRLEFLDRELGVVHDLRLPFLDIGLDFGVGVLDNLLAVLDKNLGLQISSSTLLLSNSSDPGGVVGFCMHKKTMRTKHDAYEHC